MRADLLFFTVLAICSSLDCVQSLSSYDELRCRSCVKASTLSDCAHLIICDKRHEECYMDRVVTDQLTVIYNGGCRSKNICSLAMMVGRKREMVSCARCCSTNDCNTGLCGIHAPGTTVRTTALPHPQCYTCGHQYRQSEVSDPNKCVTLGTCQSNEVCYITQHAIGSRSTYSYGCKSKRLCQLLMKPLFEDYKVCVANVTQPSIGSTWADQCGGIIRRSTEICNSCCADSGCNFGTCAENNTKLCFDKLRRTIWFISLLILAFEAALGYAQTVSSDNILQCRLCNRASTLSDCNKLVTCDRTLEACYVDELITDQLTVVYEAGCRAKDVCSQTGSSLASVGKRSDLVSCSKCCNLGNDCNKRLCGIKDDTLNSSQCYTCDHKTSDQSEVTDPMKCVTLDTCQTNEVCYATQSDIAGEDTFFYGCLSKLQCKFLMAKAYENYQICVTNTTSPPGGLTWVQACGNTGQLRSTSLCHSCCASGGCNYGPCKSLNERIFKLVDQGKFDLKTLKVV